jgi:GTP-binding protein HflX
VVQADLLLHVHDTASPLVAEEAGDVREVLADLGIDDEAQADRILPVMNKADLLDTNDARSEMLGNMFPGGCFTSALSGEGIESLLQAIDDRLGAGRLLSSVIIGPTDGAARAWLFDRGDVRLVDMADSGDETINVAMDEADWSRFRARWPALAGA